MYDPETLIYPHVLASTAPGPIDRETRYFARTVTNNMDTVVRTSHYWYIPPEDAEDHEPVLVIEIDDEDGIYGKDPMDITIRIRRNEGLIYEGNRADQEEPAPHRIEEQRVRRMSLVQANAMDIPTMEEWLKDDLPHATTVAVDDTDALTISRASYREHVTAIDEARKVLNEMGLTRPQLDQLATMILKEEA